MDESISLKKDFKITETQQTEDGVCQTVKNLECIILT